MMKWTSLVWLALPLALAAGCVQSHRPEVVYVPVPAPPGTPTSDRPATRVYPDATSSSEASPRDLAVAGAVREALRGEPALPDLSHNIEATVYNGVVTLRGSVPSENERTALVSRISKLPGVDGVKDELTVEQR